MITILRNLSQLKTQFEERNVVQNNKNFRNIVMTHLKGADHGRDEFHQYGQIIPKYRQNAC